MPHIISRFLKSIHNPVSVYSAFNDDMHILTKGLEKFKNERKIIVEICLLYLFAILVNNTDLRFLGMEIDSTVKCNSGLLLVVFFECDTIITSNRSLTIIIK